MKSSLKGISSRLDEAEDRLSYLEDTLTENTQAEKHKEKNEF